jgi:hypothetical protein
MNSIGERLCLYTTSDRALCGFEPVAVRLRAVAIRSMVLGVRTPVTTTEGNSLPAHFV